MGPSGAGYVVCAAPAGSAIRSQRLSASTAHRILVRHGLNRLDFLDRPTGQTIRRYERAGPGEPVHDDITMLGKIPHRGSRLRTSFSFSGSLIRPQRLDVLAEPFGV